MATEDVTDVGVRSEPVTVLPDKPPAAPLRQGRAVILQQPQKDGLTRENVWPLLQEARAVHTFNASDEAYLWSYFKGNQPVLKREKPVRPEICNRVVVNRAYEMAKWKVGYLLGEPVAYCARSDNEERDGSALADTTESKAVRALNDWAVASDKHAVDRDICQWAQVTGTAYRLSLPASDIADEGCACPLVTVALDPRDTFVVYSADVDRRPLWAATRTRVAIDKPAVWTVYSDKACLKVRDDDGTVLSEDSHALGCVPIVEYPANKERMGCFEPVLSLLDAINEVESNRVDGVQQFVQSFMVLTNVEVDKDTFSEMLSLGAVQISSSKEQEANVNLLSSELNQSQTQVLVDDLWKTVLSICGMPLNLGGGASTSDTGAAVTMRDGWSSAESRAKDSEVSFKSAERRFIPMALRVLNAAGKSPMCDAGCVEVKFTRRNYEAVQQKAQVLTTLLGCNKVHPQLAFEFCGMFSDPEEAWQLSRAWSEEQQEKYGFAAVAGKAAVEDIDVRGAGETGTKDEGDGDATPDNKAKPSKGE